MVEHQKTNIFSQATETLEEVSDKISEQAKILNESPAATKFHQIDRNAGRLISIVKAVGWILFASVAFFVAYVIWLTTSTGWLSALAIVFPALIGIWAGLVGVSHYSKPQTASEVLVQEVGDRLKPAQFISRVLSGKFCSGQSQVR